MKGEDSERYERILELIGYGKFQVLYNIFFAYLSHMVTACAYFSTYWVLVIPDYWCKVPMPVDSNYTIEEWKNITIPRTNWSSLREFESCKMYEYDLSDISYENTTGCKYGWDYDTTWYKRTIPSQENWVCEREVLVTNALSANSIGECIGILFFGLGRKKSLLLSNTILLIGRVMSFFTPKIYWLFYLGILIGNFASQMSMLSFMLIGMEINDAIHRPLLNLFYNLGDCSAHLVMAGLFWACGDWVVFFASMLVLLLANLIFIFKFQIESPIWLLTKGKKEECLILLTKISRINGVTFHEELVGIQDSLALVSSEREKVIPRESIFKQRSFLKNFGLIFLEWCCCMIIQGVLLLNTWYIGGNPFLIYFFQAASRIPGNVAGNYLCNRIGRRMTLLIMFPLLIVATTAMIFVTTRNAEVLPFLSVVASFFIFASNETIVVQIVEVLPDRLRSSGYSVCMLGLNLTFMLIPYILLLGKNVDARLPYIIGVVAMIVAVLACASSPETLKKKRREI